jgi:hypothetical protein
MSCLITGGINASICRDNIPGLKRLFIGNYDDVTSYDVLAGVITGCTQSGSTVFYEYKVNLNSSSLAQTPTVSVENGVAYWTMVVTAIFGKLDVAKRNLAKIMAQGNVIIVAEDNNGTFWGIGFTRPAYLSGGSLGTGTAGTDANAWTAEFTSMEQEPAYEVSSSVALGLLA